MQMDTYGNIKWIHMGAEEPGPGPKLAAGPWARDPDPGPWARDPGPAASFGPGPGSWAPI